MYGSHHGPLFRLLLAPRFAKVHIEASTAEHISDLAEQGVVVYAMRHASSLDYLFFNWLYGKLNLPLPRFGNRLSPVLWMPMMMLIKLIFGASKVNSVTRAGGLVSSGYSILLFLKSRPKDPGPDPLEYLAELVKRQRELVRPIFLVPQMLLEKEPVRLRGERLDRLFGYRFRTSGWRQVLRFWWKPHNARVMLGDIINLMHEIDMNPGSSDEEIARSIRRKLLGGLAAERRVVLGPPVKPQARMKASILASKSFREAVSKLAREQGKSEEALFKRSSKLLDEIAADFRVSMIRFMSVVLHHLAWKKMYGGDQNFIVDPYGFERMRKTAKSASLILMPCHKSHMDYLLISYMMYKLDMIPPHIAAGINLSFWPLGYFFRHAGAFFLRRTFRGDELYALVFRNYIKQLFKEGFSIEFFVEGTRSRTGKLLRPKLGILTMLVEAFMELKGRDVALVPISLSYEDVAEDSSYSNELLGGHKQKEDLKGLAKTTHVLKKEFGKVFIRFAEPIFLSSYAADCMAKGKDPLDKKSINGLAYKVLHNIDRETALTPTALAATSILTRRKSPVSQAEVVEDMEYLAEALGNAGMPLAPRLKNPVAAFIEVRNRFLGKGLIGLQHQGSEIFLTIPDNKRIQIDYYKNNAIPWLVPRAMVALSILTDHGHVSRETIYERVKELSTLFGDEFVFPPKEDFSKNLEQAINALTSEGLIIRDSSNAFHANREQADKLRFNADLMAVFIEGYHAILSCITGLVKEPVEERELSKQVRSEVNGMYIKGIIKRPEILSKTLIDNAIRMMKRLGILDEEMVPVSGSKNRYSKQLSLSDQGSKTAADLAALLEKYHPENGKYPALLSKSGESGNAS